MSIQFVSQVALPILLIIIMLSLGLGLTPDDFKRVARHPRPSLIGLACQMVLLPAFAFGIAIVFGLRPEFAIGLVMMASAPPAATANLYTKMADGDVALGISITAVATGLSALFSPVLTSFAIGHFGPTSATLEFPYSLVVKIFFLVTIPVLIGMALKSRAPRVAPKLEKVTKLISLVGLVLVIIGALVKEWPIVRDNFAEVGWAILALNLVSLSFANFSPKALGITGAQSKTISLILAVHNGSIPLYIAMSVLASTMIAVPIATYGLLMYLTAAAFSVYVRRRA